MRATPIPRVNLRRFGTSATRSRALGALGQLSEVQEADLHREFEVVGSRIDQVKAAVAVALRQSVAEAIPLAEAVEALEEELLTHQWGIQDLVTPGDVAEWRQTLEQFQVRADVLLRATHEITETGYQSTILNSVGFASAGVAALIGTYFIVRYVERNYRQARWYA